MPEPAPKFRIIELPWSKIEHEPNRSQALFDFVKQKVRRGFVVRNVGAEPHDADEAIARIKTNGTDKPNVIVECVRN